MTVLHLDVSNAFNSFNHQLEVALRNVHILCPILAPILVNTCISQPEAILFIGADYIL